MTPDSGQPGHPIAGRMVGDATAPRSHRRPEEVERKRARLEEPHVAPLTAYLRRLRAERGAHSVPWFDPAEGGVRARILLCLENPGRRADAATGSGFVSPDNDDRTAETMWHLLNEAGIDRRDVVTTNIVPWYLGDADRIGTVATADLDQARPALVELLGMLPQLRVVVLLGRAAQRGWSRADPPVDVPVLGTPHPSGRWLNSHPADRGVILGQLREAGRLATVTADAGAGRTP